MSLLARIPVFAGLSDEALRRLDGGAAPFEVHNGDEIFAQDDPAVPARRRRRRRAGCG